jgi:tRNA-specific 2-thiouridylase
MISKKVFVGVSGGVDSAVSAFLLKKAGYDVTGVYIKVWQPDWIECNWREERRDAMRVCASLDIPFLEIDFVKEYKKGVIDYMISEYISGRTPNPDVMCNREVKFGAFWDWARKNEAQYIATGHYADIQIVKDNLNKISEKYRLITSKDKMKDQTYFLWTLRNDELSHILFPVGRMTKEEVRNIANRAKLPNATKKDSQGICFIGKIDVKEFLRQYIEREILENNRGDNQYIKSIEKSISKGKVLDTEGKVIGHHPGSLFFTMGEAKGFTITKKTNKDSKYYVIKKDIKANTITVSQNKLIQIENGSTINLIKLNLINDVRENEKVMVRTRYRQTLQEGIIKDIDKERKTATLSIDKPIDIPTSGQSAVLYREIAVDIIECLGGGIIG